jgi:hypothetical protein
MIGSIESLILDYLKRIQVEQSASRDRDAEMLTRLACIEAAIARSSRDEPMTYSEPRPWE